MASTGSEARAAPTLVLFDVDGTLIDSQAILLESQRRTLAAHGLPHPGREAGLAVVGLSLPFALGALLGGEVDVEALAATYREVYAALRADPRFESPPFPGVPEALDRLEGRGFLLGLATGKSRRGVAHVLEREGWDGRFATIQTADTNPSKPDPTMILAAAAEAGVAPERTAMVGDTIFDIAMARDAGADAIGVAWGYHDPAALAEAGARAVARSAGEIADLFGA
jgi:phosphoglycolate phosphatase